MSTARGPRQSSRPAPHVRRRSVVYGIPTLPVDDHGMVIPGAAPIVGYIGKSVQTVKQREEQHRDNQSFSDIIFGGSWVIEEGWWTEEELAAREEWWIRHGAVLVPGQASQRPVYNYEFNLDNPHRIEVWRAREHRQVRDPGWMPPPKGGRVPRPRVNRSPVAVRAVRRPPRVRWTRRRVKTALLAAVWLSLVSLFWWAGWDVWPGWDGPRNSGIAASIVMATAAVLREWSRPKRRRRRR